MTVDHCPICGISESIPSPDHDHAANFNQSVCDDCARTDGTHNLNVEH